LLSLLSRDSRRLHPGDRCSSGEEPWPDIASDGRRGRWMVGARVKSESLVFGLGKS
jgi:hypothetical protein